MADVKVPVMSHTVSQQYHPDFHRISTGLPPAQQYPPPPAQQYPQPLSQQCPPPPPTQPSDPAPPYNPLEYHPEYPPPAAQQPYVPQYPDYPLGLQHPVELAPPPYEEQPKAGEVNFAGPEYDVEGSTNSNCTATSQDGLCEGIVSFDNKSIRLGFIRKVFAILAMQMIVTCAMIAWFLFHEPTKNFVQTTPSVYYASFGVYLVLYFVLVCCSAVAATHPFNLILLGLFTLSLGYVCAAISSFYDTKIVMSAFGMTVFCCFGIILFASQTKYDITLCSGTLFVFAFSLIMFGMFGGIMVPYGYMKFTRVAYSALFCLLFMGYLAWDVQMMMGGKTYEIDPDDYVFCAIQIYVDVIYIFLFILKLFASR